VIDDRRSSVPRIAATVMVLVIAAGASAGAQQQFQFFLSAANASGARVSDLRLDEVAVSEGGRPARVVRIDPVSWPVKVTVMVDNGMGTGNFLVQYRNGLKGFFEALPIKERDTRGFVTQEARRRKLRIAPQAIDALVDSVGVDLPAIDDALERLSLFVGPEGSIDLAAVDACVTRVRSESIWALVDAVGLRDRKTALRATASLLADREPPLRILAMVARQLRMVARMKSALISGASEADATRAAGAPPFKARELAQAARRLDAASLSRAFGVLAETDLALKGSKRPPDVVLESAILALTR
jgi:DNA polymerase III delta subunit